MKRIFKTIAFASLLFLASCGNNPEKSRNFYDKGMDYLYCSQFEEAIMLDSQGNFSAYWLYF